MNTNSTSELQAYIREFRCLFDDSFFAGGFLIFVGGMISAIWGFPAATVMAVGGMIVVFVGGVLRVYTD